MKKILSLFLALFLIMGVVGASAYESIIDIDRDSSLYEYCRSMYFSYDIEDDSFNVLMDGTYRSIVARESGIKLILLLGLDAAVKVTENHSLYPDTIRVVFLAKDGSYASYSYGSDGFFYLSKDKHDRLVDFYEVED